MRVIFTDGSILDTSDDNSVADFRKINKDFINAILNIRQQITQSQEIVDFIKKKFAIKNTSDYSINAFLDFTDPIKIIERLIIGSKGTLGFVSNVTLNIVVDYKYKVLNLIYDNLDELINLKTKLQIFAPSSVKLFDYLLLKSVSGVAELQPFLIKLEDSQQSLEAQLNALNQNISMLQIYSYQVGFRRDEQQMQTLWKAHNVVLPTIVAQRPNDSSVLIEDIAVNILDLPNLISDIKKLFVKQLYKCYHFGACFSW